MTARALTTEIQSLVAATEDIRSRASAATSGLSTEALLWSPASDTWSMAQVFEHLNKVGYGMLPGLTNAVEELHKDGIRADGPFRYSLLERAFLKFMSPNPPFRVPVPPGFEPTAKDSGLQDAPGRFLVLQDRLSALMADASGYDLTAKRVPSVVEKRMKICVGAWFHATVGHEQYHLLQIEALRNNPLFPHKPGV